MSMTVLTILQIMGILAAYLGVTLVLPCILLRGRLRPYRLSVRFMAYFVAGNFYLINLVMALQLLHLSCRLTLIAGTLLPFVLAAALWHRSAFIAGLRRTADGAFLVLSSQVGFKTALLRLGGRARRFFSRVLRGWILPRWPELLLTGGIAALVFYMYGANALKEFGYCASDLPVHNYWINEMGGNNIFAAGVYPFGFHCVIYYLHTVFAIPTYVLLRLFFVAQTLMIHLMLLAFLKGVCRTRYVPYAGVIAYLTTDTFYMYAYARYYSSLPQEFGMLFILPAVYFLIAFLQQDGSKLPKKIYWKDLGAGQPGFYLAMFAVSVSLTLAGHFYDAIITALFCVGVAAGFCFRCFRWPYLKRILAGGLAGIFLAVLPMGIAYAAGKGLEGSLYWAMSVMSQDKEEEEPSGEAASGGVSGTEHSAEETEQADSPEPVPRPSPLSLIMGKLRVFVANGSAGAANFFAASIGISFLLGALWCALRRPEYGAVLLSTGVFVAILFLLQASKELGLPQVLEEARYPVYEGYGLAAVWGLCLDAGLCLIFRERGAVLHIGSLAAVVCVCVVVALTGTRECMQIGSTPTNSAVVCMTNIIRENRNGTWTICSANEELQMARDYGYHYEIIDFLREMEGFDGEATIHIPTDTVYFFIEKEPRQTDGADGQEMSGAVNFAQKAESPLPGGAGVSVYEDDARLTVMSRMYYWAQEFQRLYPNEMEIYYEAEDFVCYRVRQNPYALYNFAIDYGYN